MTRAAAATVLVIATVRVTRRPRIPRGGKAVSRLVIRRAIRRA